MPSNPILYQYKGVNIRKYNKVVFRVGENSFRKLIDETERTGLSCHKILAYTSRPCEICKSTDVTVYHEDRKVNIKKGLLHVPQNSGVNITKTNYKKESDD